MKSFVLPVPPDSPDLEITYGDIRVRVCEATVSKTCPKLAHALSGLPRSVRTFPIKDAYYLTNPSSIELFFSVLEGKPIQLTDNNAKDLEFLADVWDVASLKWAANDFIKTSLLERALEQNRVLEGQVRLLRQELNELKMRGVVVAPTPTQAPEPEVQRERTDRLMAEGEDYVEEDQVEESGNEPEPAPARDDAHPDGDALIAKLWEITGGNPVVNGAVEIAGTSYNFVHAQNLPNLIDPKWDGFWTSQNGAGATLQVEFIERRAKVTGYSIKSFKGDPGAMHMKSWVLEGYRDGDWIVLDERNNCAKLNGESATGVFVCATAAVVSQLKLKMVGKNWAGGKQMFITNIEFFGEFVDK